MTIFWRKRFFYRRFDIRYFYFYTPLNLPRRDQLAINRWWKKSGSFFFQEKWRIPLDNCNHSTDEPEDGSWVDRNRYRLLIIDYWWLAIDSASLAQDRFDVVHNVGDEDLVRRFTVHAECIITLKQTRKKSRKNWVKIFYCSKCHHKQ